MDRHDDMCVWIHVHLLQSVLLAVSSGLCGYYAVNLNHQAQLDLGVPAERDDIEGSLCDGLQVPWSG